MTHTRKTSPHLALVITCAASFVATFAASSTNIALPPIGHEFHLGSVSLNWIVTAFALTSALLILPVGRIGDFWGRQNTFRVGMAIYTVGNALSSFAHSEALLIASRIFAGVGASLTLGTVTAILIVSYPPEKRGAILGINVAMVYLGLSAGPFLGGLIVQTLGWRYLFILTASLGVAVFFSSLFFLRDNDREQSKGKFDSIGMLLYCAGLPLLLLGLSDLSRISGISFTIVGLILIAAFLFWEARNENPLLPMHLFLNNTIFAYSNLAAMISYSATFSVAFFLSLYLQIVKGFPPVVSGILMVGQPIIQALLSPIAGHLSDRISPRLLASTGMAFTSLGLLCMVFLSTTSPLAIIIVSQIFLGMGFALFSSPNNNAVLGSVTRAQIGLASSTIATMRMVGQIFSMGLSLGLLSLFVGTTEVSAGQSSTFLHAQGLSFTISAILCALGIVASLARGSLSSGAQTEGK